MIQTKEYFEQMLADLSAQLKIANERLVQCPAGSLVKYNREGKDTYFQVVHEGCTRQRTGITRNKQLIKELTEKVYLKTEIEILEKDISAFDSNPGVSLLTRHSGARGLQHNP